MSGRKKQQMKAIGRSHVWVWVIVLCLIFIVTSVAIGIIAGLYGSTMLFSKYSSEYDRISEIAMIYENAVGSNTELADIFAGTGRDVIVTDADNNVIYASGRNTCSFAGGEVYGFALSSALAKFSADDDPERSAACTVYRDSEMGALYVTEDHELTLDLFALDGSYYLNNFDFDPADGDNITDADEREIVSGTGFIGFPYWLSLDVNGGTQHFISKAYISVNINDASTIVVSFIGIVLLMMVLFIILIVNIVNSMLRRNRMLKVFFTDVLTAGNNYMHFAIRGGELIHKRASYGTRYAVVDLSFVNYRFFCVCHSVAEGEQMLCKVHDTIRANIDPKKEMLAHCGYSEFALLLRFTDEEALKRRMMTLIGQLEKIHGEHKFVFHAGIAVIEPDGTPDKNGTPVKRRDTDIEIMYTNACTACESLSANGDSGIAMFDAKLIEDQRWIDAVQEHQQKAIDNEEFMVYYQPKYDPRTDELRGAEALIRWQSPEFGFVPPGKIIPIFEKNGFITEIDHYMISHVARDQKQWLDMGYKCVPVSVNVSRAHFIESDLAEQIRDMIDEAGCPHELVEIELTESAFFDDKKAMLNTIMKLKSFGFAVSMDDFGSGYSSLNSLKDMPLDVLKLDAEFFRGENDDGRGEIVVTEAIRLAKSLNMRTVAEGVEVREQVDFLASQGCDMIQGYYYAKPMPKTDYQQRMKPQEA